MERQVSGGLGFFGGLAIFLGLALLGYLVSTSSWTIRRAERTVTVKGLSEREVAADIAIWPIKFTEVENALDDLYANLQAKSDMVTAFLKENGFDEAEIAVGPPAITDRMAEYYGGNERIPFRYSASVVVTVYTARVDRVLATMQQMVALGRQGIVVGGQNYDTRTEFLFTGLNDIKPAMIEEATKNAREVARKFAQDSDSTLGKIKEAHQGQFTISDRDSNTPHIKKVRVVSTVVYYLSD